jgi:hypothetical protein
VGDLVSGARQTELHLLFQVANAIFTTRYREMYARDNGFVVSLVVAAIMGIGTFAIFLKPMWQSYPARIANIKVQPRRSALSRLKRGLSGIMPDDPELRRASWLSSMDMYFTVVSGISAFAASFCITFAVLNPLLQLDKLFSGGELGRQLQDGTLVLRLSTIAFASTVLWRAVLFLRRKEDREFESDVENVPELLNDDMRFMRDAAQSAAFLAALFALWLLYAREVSTPSTALLAYVFAFFSDDWWIMSDYSRPLKGRLLRWHGVRLDIANVLLLAPIAVIAWQEFRWWGALTWYSVAAFILIPRYLLFRPEWTTHRGGASEWRFRQGS